MEKIIHEDRKRRKTTLCNTLKKDQLLELEELPLLAIQEAKTVKGLQKKSQKIPFLNMDNLRHIQRHKIMSTNNRSPGKLMTEKDDTHFYESKICFLQGHDNQLKLSQKLVNDKCHGLNQITKKTCIFPSIDQHKHHMHASQQKHLETLENFVETRRKKSKHNIHCKVLLAKNSHFPFIGSHIYEMKHTDSMGSKQNHNTQVENNPELFPLDISRINEVEEPPSPAFISRESFYEIAIF